MRWCTDCVGIGIFLDGIWWKDLGMSKSYQTIANCEWDTSKEWQPKETDDHFTVSWVLAQILRNVLVNSWSTKAKSFFFFFLPMPETLRQDFTTLWQAAGRTKEETAWWFCFKKIGSRLAPSLCYKRNPMHGGPFPHSPLIKMVPWIPQL